MIHKNNRKQHTHGAGRIIANMLLAVVLVCGLAGPLTPKAEAASWMDPYLQKVVDWGVMRGDIHGNLDADRAITRAEFVSMVNRAYGYDQMAQAPFKDIALKNWYYEDICIGWNTGYFAGTSPTTASPLMALSREQAAVLIGHNMMLQQDTGEALGFADSRQCADWSRHMVQAMSKEGVISGSPNGNFYPKRSVTRGEVAVMLVKAIGTPIQEPGEKSLGGVYGNVTITSPGVTLKNTTVYGDLYITGGVGLSNVVLENVKVTGKIVVSGTGESEKGEHSVILRNVTAEELVLDSLKSHFVTLKAEGLTNIKTVNARTGTFLEDVTNDGLGLQNIVLDGERGTTYNLAGNIKEVLVKAPASVVSMGQGVANVITVDETGVGTNLQISDKATVNTVNLDTAASVTGTGDIGHMNVNTAGSSSTILPDTIVVRPGVEITVQNEVMDSVAAQESSSDPRLLSGYPMAKNISPKSAEVAFKANKTGTVYWAVTALNDGTVGEEELIHPPAYSGKILKSGTTAVTASNTEFVEKISGLTTDGSYYISAILVDKRGMRSPVKIDAFTTPDDTVPAFASGYPYAIMTDDDNDEQIIQAMVMPNKNCQMYYALMPKGSSAPKPADFKANAITGNLGYGVVDLQKNTPFLIAKVNSVHLKEETDYDLYLWLTDADGTKSSAVKKLTVRTLDRTPPKIQHLTLSEASERSVSLTYALSEPGTFYWAVVKRGAPFYLEGVEDVSPEGMAQVESGINAIKKGSSSASKGMTDVKFNISGLEAQTAYDVYYMAKDKAGNYCIYDKTVIELPYTVYTLDNVPPTVKQEFTNDGSSGGKVTPYPDTSIRLVFSENVQGMKDRNEDGRSDYEVFLDLYGQYQNKKITDELWTAMMREYFKLYVEGEKDPVKDRVKDGDTDWVIDYRKVTFELDPSGTGELIMTFPYNSDSALSAVNLSGGITYHFELEGLADTSTAANRMEGQRGITKLPEFTTISAQIMLAKSPIAGQDMTFTARPISNTSMPNSVLYDLVVWSDVQVSFELYTYDEASKVWNQVGAGKTASIVDGKGQWYGVSLGNALLGSTFGQLNKAVDTVYGIRVTSMNGDPVRDNWNQPITLQVTAVSGSEASLPGLSDRLGNGQTYEQAIEGNTEVADITTPLDFTMTHIFLDNTPPSFDVASPSIKAGDTSVELGIMLDRPNAHYYYVLAPLGSISTSVKLPGEATDTTIKTEESWAKLPKDGKVDPAFATKPTNHQIIAFKPTTTIRTGTGTFNGAEETVRITGLMPNTKYVAYIVLRGESQESVSEVYCYGVATGDVDTPIITLSEQSPNAMIRTSTEAAVDWILLPSTSIKDGMILGREFKGEYVDSSVSGAPAGMTIIDALTQESSSGRSIFDDFASEKAKQEVLDFIKTTAGDSYLTDRGQLNTKASTSNADSHPETLTFKNMSLRTQYYCVATAHHTMGVKQSFKAVGNIHLVDHEPPKLTVCDTVLTEAKNDKGQTVPIADTLEKPSSYSYSGVLALQFDKPIYRVYEDTPNHYTSELLNKVTAQKYIVQVPSQIVDDGKGGIEVTGETILIHFKDVKNGYSFSMFSDGYVGNASSDIAGKLTLRFRTKILNPNKELPVFEPEWSELGGKK